MIEKDEEDTPPNLVGMTKPVFSDFSGNFLKNKEIS